MVRHRVPRASLLELLLLGPWDSSTAYDSDQIRKSWERSLHRGRASSSDENSEPNWE